MKEHPINLALNLLAPDHCLPGFRQFAPNVGAGDQVTKIHAHSGASDGAIDTAGPDFQPHGNHQ